MTLVILAILSLVTLVAPAGWPQWGGPNRDFRVTTASLASRWSEAGPSVRWDRPLGPGHAAIVADDATIYTMYGGGATETVVALDAETGDTRWSSTYPVGYEASTPIWKGPHATPLLVGDLLITVGIDAQVHAFDRRDGTVRWRRDLVAEFDVDLPQAGYAASPLAWGGLVLLPGLGGRAPAAIALRRDDGTTAWARHAFTSSHAAPILIETDGREHAVFHGMDRLVGLDPGTGQLLWRTRLRTNAIDNVAFTPLWDPGRRVLLVSHGYDRGGTRAIRLTRDAGEWTARQIWSSRRLKVVHGNGVLVEGVLYASDGDESSFLVGVDLDGGDVRFKQRGTPKATFLAVRDRLLILDADGRLHLGRPDADGIELRASVEILRSPAWTVPTLVGRTLYLRDASRIKRVDLP